MLLFKQKTDNNLSFQQYPSFQNNIEKKQEQNEQLPTISNDKNSIYTTIPTVSNNRYDSIKDISFNNNNNNLYTLNNDILTSPKIIPNTTIKQINDNKFYAKVILQNIPSAKELILLLEDYLTEKKYKIYYETSYEADKITFTFQEEKIAFEFTKLIYNEKNRRPKYKDIIVHLSLSPNETYIKKTMENKRRGISPESILKLFNGNSYVKKIKPPPKIYGNINFGIKSPFYNVHQKKYKINKSTNKGKSFSDKNLFNSINGDSVKGDINGFVGYDGKPLKNYEKLRISVLDTHYNPISGFEYREDNKSRWLSPSNFKFY